MNTGAALPRPTSQRLLLAFSSLLAITATAVSVYLYALRTVPSHLMNAHPLGSGQWMVLVALAPIALWGIWTARLGMLSVGGLLLAGGGLSNLTCLWLLGGVPDYLVFHHARILLGGPHDLNPGGVWLFNIGDLTITLGFLIVFAALVVDQLRNAQKRRASRNASVAVAALPTVSA